jgi:penicillin-binding protein 2
MTTPDGQVIQRNTPKAARTLPISPENLDVVKQGLDAVVNTESGTGYHYARPENVRIAGKTGTAEYCDDIALKNGDCLTDRQPSHAWFAAYGPTEDPEIAVLVFIYNGGQGSEVAAPVAKKIFEYYFGRSTPPAPEQTGQVTAP